MTSNAVSPSASPKKVKIAKPSLAALISAIYVAFDGLSDVFLSGGKEPSDPLFTADRQQVVAKAEQVLVAARQVAIAALKIQREAARPARVPYTAKKLAQRIAKREAMIAKAVAQLETMKKEAGNG